MIRAPLLLFALASLAALSNAAIPSDWVQYTPGACGLVVSSPHGGSLKPSFIADRTDGCLQADGVTCRWVKGCSPSDSDTCGAATAKDSFTQEIAALVVKRLVETYGCTAHFVRSNLQRVKLDPNREISEAAQGDQSAEEAWRVYHENFMVTAVRSASAAGSGRALVIDIHGQGHPEQWSELGYLFSASDLNSGPKSLARSSIRNLAARTGLSPSDLLVGPKSFGAILASYGHKIVPSPTIPSPGNGNYFNGGYTTNTYSSSDFGLVDAIQVEICSGIRMDQARRERFAADLADSINDFRRIHGYV